VTRYFSTAVFITGRNWGKDNITEAHPALRQEFFIQGVLQVWTRHWRSSKRLESCSCGGWHDVLHHVTYGCQSCGQAHCKAHCQGAGQEHSDWHENIPHRTCYSGCCPPVNLNKCTVIRRHHCQHWKYGVRTTLGFDWQGNSNQHGSQCMHLCKAA